MLKKFFGSANDRKLRSAYKSLKQINALEPQIQALADHEFKSKTEELKDRYTKGESLDSMLPEAFALVREASFRVLKMRHFDVQLIGGIILHNGMITEMKTGEGKTLAATLPAYLNALTGGGVHIVTVNDYLAKRDAEWMGPIYEFLGLKCAYLINSVEHTDRKLAYQADILYATNNELGFDYLRDNLKFSKEQMVQRNFNFAIVDEVDSILIDEARTPLIISGPADSDSKLYQSINAIALQLKAEHYDLDEKTKNVTLTDEGNSEVEKLLRQQKLITEDATVFDNNNIQIIHYINQAIRAHKAYHKDVDYIIADGKVMIIDEFTGRIMEGRRFAEGLHQALEAKEGVTIQRENQTLASITFQNYFRMYSKLAGMTGTALTEANEFMDIYKLECIAIPTHIPVIRVDENDIIYRTAEEKYDAVIAKIEEAHAKGQPILVGTVSIEKSELVSKILKKHKLPHNVLNARNHEQEAQIIAQAGRLGAITVATNMAGRGTDIKLGGNPEALVANDNKIKNLKEAIDLVAEEKEKVLKAGGLLVIATERHESRRIDNQLRGRSGRQGDPGRTVFYLSLEDDLMRLFGSEKISNMLGKFGFKKGEAIVHSFVSRAIEKAQQKVEARNYDIRKNLLKYDDVMNQQRHIIYARRAEIMEAEDFEPIVRDLVRHSARSLINAHIPEKSFKEQWDLESLAKEIHQSLGININLSKLLDAVSESEQDRKYLSKKVEELAFELYENKKKIYGQSLYNRVIASIMLSTLDQLWKEHLHCLDHLRGGIHLRAYAQKNPLLEYQFEAFSMFKQMLADYENMIIFRILNVQINIEESGEEQLLSNSNASLASNSDEGKNHNSSIVRGMPKNFDPQDQKTWGRVARNSLCPCGSGKKYKYCHGAL